MCLLMSTPLVNARPVSVAAFDLDGTLVRGSSFGQFVRLLIYGSPWRLLVAMGLSPVAAALLAMTRTRPLAGSVLVWLATVGRTEPELRRRARTFAHWHAGAESGNRVDVGLARLAEHQRSGAQIVISTAAVEPVASEVVWALGIEGAHVLAPRLRPVRRGRVPDRDRKGAAKVTRLVAAGYRVPVDYAYSDSAHDIDLLQAARHPMVVEPRALSWRLLRAAVPDCTILTDGQSAMMSGTSKLSRGST